MDLRHLRNFVAVAEELHFARAAARLGMEQSPLSRSIQDLEADLKIRLFARTRRSTALTPAGAVFLSTAKRILTDADMALREMRTFAGDQPVRLGLAEGLAGPAFSRLMAAVGAAHPSSAPSLVERPLVELLALCANEVIDGVLAPEQAATSELQSVLAWEEPLVLVGGEDGRPVRLAGLHDATWILLDPQALPGLAQQVSAVLEQAGLTISAAGLAATPASLVGLVQAGLGVGLLPIGLAPAGEAVVVRPIVEPFATVSTWLTTRREDHGRRTRLIRDLAGRSADQSVARR